MLTELRRDPAQKGDALGEGKQRWIVRLNHRRRGANLGREILHGHEPPGTIGFRISVREDLGFTDVREADGSDLSPLGTALMHGLLSMGQSIVIRICHPSSGESNAPIPNFEHRVEFRLGDQVLALVFRPTKNVKSVELSDYLVELSPSKPIVADDSRIRALVCRRVREILLLLYEEVFQIGAIRVPELRFAFNEMDLGTPSTVKAQKRHYAERHYGMLDAALGEMKKVFDLALPAAVL